jgi:hypothetical protein
MEYPMINSNEMSTETMAEQSTTLLLRTFKATYPSRQNAIKMIQFGNGFKKENSSLKDEIFVFMFREMANNAEKHTITTL